MTEDKIEQKLVKAMKKLINRSVLDELEDDF